MATYANLLNSFAYYTGETDSVNVTAGGGSIIYDTMLEIASRYPFLCYQKTTSLTIASGSIALPTDIDLTHLDKIRVYTYSSTDKTDWTETTLDELSKYTDEYYAIDLENLLLKGSKDATISFQYQYVPTEPSSSTDSIKFPIYQCIARLAAGQYWQSIEEDSEQAQMNFAAGEELYQRAVARDQRLRPSIKINHYLCAQDLGF